MKAYTGTIVADSLDDVGTLEGLEIVKEEISPNDNWCLYKVKADREQIEKLQKHIVKGPWYMHFWRGKGVLVVFRNKIFHLNYDDRNTWDNAVKHGISIGIPKHQLDFLIE